MTDSQHEVKFDRGDHVVPADRPSNTVYRIEGYEEGQYRATLVAHDPTDSEVGMTQTFPEDDFEKGMKQVTNGEAYRRWQAAVFALDDFPAADPSDRLVVNIDDDIQTITREQAAAVCRVEGKGGLARAFLSGDYGAAHFSEIVDMGLSPETINLGIHGLLNTQNDD